MHLSQLEREVLDMKEALYQHHQFSGHVVLRTSDMKLHLASGWQVAEIEGEKAILLDCRTLADSCQLDT